MSARSGALLAAVVALALAAAVVVVADVRGPVRIALSLAFLFVCPGWALIGFLRLRDAVAELWLAIALSIALDTAVSAILLYSHAWSPTGGLLILVGICLAGVAGQTWLALRRQRRDGALT